MFEPSQLRSQGGVPTWRGRWLVLSEPNWQVHHWSWWSHRLATVSPLMAHLHTQIGHLAGNNTYLGASNWTSNWISASLFCNNFQHVCSIPWPGSLIRIFISSIVCLEFVAHWLSRCIMTVWLCSHWSRHLAGIRKQCLGGGLAINSSTKKNTSRRKKYTYFCVNFHMESLLLACAVIVWKSQQSAWFASKTVRN